MTNWTGRGDPAAEAYKMRPLSKCRARTVWPRSVAKVTFVALPAAALSALARPARANRYAYGAEAMRAVDVRNHLKPIDRATAIPTPPYVVQSYDDALK